MKIIEDLDKLQLDYAKSLADTGGFLASQTANLNRVSPNTIRNFFQDTETSVGDIASYMEALYQQNGIVNGTIKYLQSHLTYNHSIYPTMNAKSGYAMSNDNEEYAEVANEVDSYNIKFFAPYFIKRALLSGVGYFYEIKDSRGVAYLEFPVEWCRVYEINSSVYRWELDISQLNADSVGLPTEIQRALEQHASGQTEDEKKWSEGKWYKLGDKAVAFALDLSVLRTAGVQISELASILLESINLENAKNNVEIVDTLDTVRLLHSEIPTDKDGRPLMSSKTARIYDRQFKNSLPKGVAGITSPMKITNVPLSGSGNNSSYSTLEKSQEQLFLATGTPSNLFGGNTTSSNIVKMAVQKDANWLYTNALPLLENFYNYKLSKFKTSSGMTWKIKFIRQSNFTLKEDIANTEKQLSMGGSRLDYLASVGMAPAEVFGKLLMEQQMLDIDSIMLPKSTSFTMSGSDAGSSGRPKTEEPTDDTVRINDSL